MNSMFVNTPMISDVEYLDGLQLMGFDLDRCLAALLSTPHGSLEDVLAILTANDDEAEEAAAAEAGSAEAAKKESSRRSSRSSSSAPPDEEYDRKLAGARALYRGCSPGSARLACLHAMRALLLV